MAVENQLFDTSIILKESLNELTSIFSKISIVSSNKIQSTNDTKGENLLVLQKSLSPIIDSLTTFSNLKKLTRISKVIWIEDEPNTSNNYEILLRDFKNIVFLCDGSNKLLDSINIIVKSKVLPFINKNQVSNTVSLILTNQLVKSTELMIENYGLKGDLSLYNWNSFLPIVIENDLISLNLKYGGLKELFNDLSIEPINLLSNSLFKLILESNYKIRLTNIYLKGDNSIKFWKLFKDLYDKNLNSLDLSTKKLINDQDDTLFMDQFSFFNRNVDFICFDRGADLVSCLLTQLTYSGLTDETIGVNLGNVSFKTDNEEDDNEEIKFKLGDSKDDIYPLIKNLNFSMVGSILNENAKKIQMEFDKKNSLNDISAIKNFVNELNKLKEQQIWIQKHTLLAEHILKSVKSGGGENDVEINELIDVEIPIYNYFNEFIELQQDILSDNLDNKKNSTRILEFMYKYEPKFQDIVKLLILSTIIKKGLREFEYNLLKQEFLNFYGIKYLPLFIKLRESKLIYPKNSSTILFSLNSNNQSSIVNDDELFGPIQLIKDFNHMKNSLNLMPIIENQDLNNPVDADFALPGYIPIITRLVQSIYDRNFLSNYNISNIHTVKTRYKKYGWDNLDLSNLNGELKQDFLIPENKKNLFNSTIPIKMLNGSTNSSTTSNFRKDLIILSVIGGLTYSEISTIRFVLNQNELTRGKQVIILTTGIIKGDDIVDCFI